MVTPAPSLPTIRRVGRYRLGRRIGAGGMAAVFAARKDEPTGLGRLVALKVMSTALIGDPDFERMFMREAGITARLEHPNIVRVYEVGEDDETLYIAMEFVNGPSLRALGRQGRLPLAEAIQIMLDAARGLHAAHELRDADDRPLGLVHQDFTPHNVMVTYDGITKLLDFGVARLAAIEGSRTETIRGKPTYMAPEQVVGGRIDRRTDVFAFGIVLFEMLTGRKLFQPKGQLDALATVVEAPIPRVRDVAPDVPADVAAVCERALQRDADARYGDMRTLAQSLVEARRSAGIESVDADALGAWVARRLPPPFTANELEREIVRPAAAAHMVNDVADLPTVREGRGNEPASPGPARRSRRRLIGAVGALLIGGVGAFVVLRPRSATNESAVGVSTTGTQPKPQTEPIASTEPKASLAGEAPSASARESPGRDSTPPTPAPRRPAPKPATIVEPAAPPDPTSAPPEPTSTSAPTENPPPAPATIVVGSNEWGAVYVDGSRVGDSPVSLTTTPGPHLVTLETPDGKTQSQSVNAVSGQTSRVRFVF